MSKFNEVAQSVLKEEKREYYAKIANILTSHGLKAYEMEPLMVIVQEAIKMAYKEGYKAGSENPFRK
jgi:hypothetical protein